MVDVFKGWPRRSVLLIVLCAVIVSLGLSAWTLSGRILGPASRALELTETIQVEVPPGINSMRVWIPRLAGDEFQPVELIEMDAPWPHKTVQDPDFGNVLFYLEAKSPRPGPAKLRLKYRLTRKEQDRPEEIKEAVPELFKKARGLVVIDDEIRRIARDATRGFKDPFSKAKALYDYVLGHVDYDTAGTGWGRGDVVYACRIGKGNCTDFHSLFIALARAEGIPARFKIGYPLPEIKEGLVEKPYHCWAEFHIEGQGWIPVDISEAWKDPAKADYYFGNLDENRILVSTGREILLPYQKGPPLNYLVSPYAEADGQPLPQVQVQLFYRNLKKGLPG